MSWYTFPHLWGYLKQNVCLEITVFEIRISLPLSFLKLKLDIRLKTKQFGSVELWQIMKTYLKDGRVSLALHHLKSSFIITACKNRMFRLLSTKHICVLAASFVNACRITWNAINCRMVKAMA